MNDELLALGGRGDRRQRWPMPGILNGGLTGSRQGLPEDMAGLSIGGVSARNDLKA